MAATIDGTNAYIADIVADGLENIMVFRKETPDNIQKHIKAVHNQFHSGSDSTFVELFDLVDEVEKAWHAHKKDIGALQHCNVERRADTRHRFALAPPCATSSLLGIEKLASQVRAKFDVDFGFRWPSSLPLD